MCHIEDTSLLEIRHLGEKPVPEMYHSDKSIQEMCHSCVTSLQEIRLFSNSSVQEMCQPGVTSVREICQSCTSVQEICHSGNTSVQGMCQSCTSMREIYHPGNTSLRTMCKPYCTLVREMCQSCTSMRKIRHPGDTSVREKRHPYITPVQETCQSCMSMRETRYRGNTSLRTMCKPYCTLVREMCQSCTSMREICHPGCTSVREVRHPYVTSVRSPGALVTALLLLLLCAVPASRGFQCGSCERDRCEPPADCAHGHVLDDCSCCLVCARGLNDTCHGPYAQLGRCAQHLVCLTQPLPGEEPSPHDEGVCRPLGESAAHSVSLPSAR